MLTKMHRSMVPEVVLLLVLLTTCQNVRAKENTNNQQQQQPLASLDKVVRQANGIRLDSLMDNKLASNVSITLNEMAMSLRKMFMENRRLSSQVQDVLLRVQNATGVNATSTINNLQATNISSLSDMNLNKAISRFQTQ